MARPSHPSNLELQALSVIWHEGPSTVSTVHAALPDGKERAYTTVLSVMQSLERKKLVKRSSIEGRAHVYDATYSQDIIVRSATHDFLNAFGGRLESRRQKGSQESSGQESRRQKGSQEGPGQKGSGKESLIL